jgi:ABC-type polysaccharide/polyol phosphate export permease
MCSALTPALSDRTLKGQSKVKRVRMLRDLVANQLLIREVGNITHHAGYKELWLGYGWSYLEPIIFTVAYYLFVRLVRSSDASSADTLLLTILSGQAVFGWFTKTISGAPGSIEKYQNILLTMRIEPLVLLAADFHVYVKSAMAGFVLLFAALVIFGVTPSLTWLLTIPLILLMGGLLFPLAVILGIFGVYVKDTGRLMSTLSRLMIFVTPVLFSLRDVHNHLRFIIELNPIAQLIELLRSALIYQIVPEPFGIAYVLTLCVILWAIAWLLLNKFSRHLAKEL